MADDQTTDPGTDASALPAQATGDTLPGQAADWADIAPATSAQNALLSANFGDQGAQAYQRLQAAGRAAPTPGAAPVAPMANLAVPPTSPGIGGNPGEVVGSALLGFATGNPLAGREAQIQRLKLQQEQQALVIARQREMRENSAEFLTQIVPSVFKAFPGRPDLAANELQAAAAARGLDMPRELLIKVNQDMADGKLSASDLLRIQNDPNTPIATAVRLAPLMKQVEANAQVNEAVNKAQASTFAPATAAATLREREAGARREETMANVALDTPEKQAAAEANRNGLAPGTPNYTNYINGRVAVLKRDQAMETEVAKVRADIQNKPLPMGAQKVIKDAEDAYDLAGDLKKLYSDPAIANNRDELAKRVKQALDYKLGGVGGLPPGVDSLIALQSLLSIGASAQFMHGMRNPQYIKDYIMDHMPKTIDTPDLVRTKLENMQRFAGRSIKNQYDQALSGAGERQAEKGRPIPPLPGLTAPEGQPDAGTPTAGAGLQLPPGFSISEPTPAP